MSGTRRVLGLEERFWSGVDTSDVDGCWPWVRSRFNKRGGYGQFHDWPRVLAAHRVAYELTYGPIPVGLQIRHTCDNPPCVNPRHLWLGTNTDNQRDASRKGRSVDHRGERHPLAKLTTDAVRAIRQSPRASRAELASRFGVSTGTIGSVRAGRLWGHVR